LKNWRVSVLFRAGVALALLVGLGGQTMSGQKRQTPKPGPAPMPPPELVLTGGKIFIGDDEFRYAEALAIRGDRIIAVGPSRDVLALAGRRTRIIPLAGHIVIPGINDAHLHHTPNPPGTRLQLEGLDPAWADVTRALEAAARSAPKGSWIFGTIGATALEADEATRDTLDRLAPEQPVLLRTYFGHGEIANSAALAALGVADQEPDPLGGYFERSPETKRINGRFFEYAEWVIERRLASLASDAQIEASLRRLADEALPFGVTTIQSMSYLPIERYVQALRPAQLPLRMRVIRFPPTGRTQRVFKEGRNLPLRPPGLPLVTVRGTKWILDGTPLERGAALRAGYVDRPGAFGKLNFSRDEIVRMLRESNTAGDQLLLHVAGDKTAETVVAAMESLPDVDWPSKRVRFEHGYGLLKDLIPRAKRLGVIVVQNPSHYADPLRDRWGADDFQPLRSLLEARIPVALGSDGPLNPYLNVMFAVTHPNNTTEAITREQAVSAYTRGSAVAEFTEGDKGRIAVGQLADLAVLSQDIFTIPLQALPATRSILTLVGGKIVYDSGAIKHKK
jgi:predicted amidohydrolase YtcJ